MTMREGQDADLLIQLDEDHGIGEASEEHAPHAQVSGDAWDKGE